MINCNIIVGQECGIASETCVRRGYNTKQFLCCMKSALLLALLFNAVRSTTLSKNIFIGTIAPYVSNSPHVFISPITAKIELSSKFPYKMENMSVVDLEDMAFIIEEINDDNNNQRSNSGDHQDSLNRGRQKYTIRTSKNRFLTIDKDKKLMLTGQVKQNNQQSLPIWHFIYNQERKTVMMQPIKYVNQCVSFLKVTILDEHKNKRNHNDTKLGLEPCDINNPMHHFKLAEIKKIEPKHITTIGFDNQNTYQPPVNPGNYGYNNYPAESCAGKNDISMIKNVLNTIVSSVMQIEKRILSGEPNNNSTMPGQLPSFYPPNSSSYPTSPSYPSNSSSYPTTNPSYPGNGSFSPGSDRPSFLPYPGTDTNTSFQPNTMPFTSRDPHPFYQSNPSISSTPFSSQPQSQGSNFYLKPNYYPREGYPCFGDPVCLSGSSFPSTPSSSYPGAILTHPYIAAPTAGIPVGIYGQPQVPRTPGIPGY